MTNQNTRTITSIETTDGRYNKVDANVWWDKTGIDLVDESVVDAHMEANQVGIVVLETVEEIAEDDAPAPFGPR